VVTGSTWRTNIRPLVIRPGALLIVQPQYNVSKKHLN